MVLLRWQQFGRIIEVSSYVKQILMGGLLYLIAVILIIGWLLGFFAFHLGGLIHILLVIAIIAILLRIIGGSRW